MKKLVLALVLLSSFLYANPYKNLSYDEKLNLMVNYFVNAQIESKKPPVPVKEKLKDDGANLDPIRHELYFNYVQRLKAIHESRQEEQEKLDEKHRGKIGFYNGKLRTLKKYYQKQENLDPIISSAVNRAFKVVYGKPEIKNLKYEKILDTVSGIFHVSSIYDIEKFEDKKIYMKFPKERIKDFIENYDQIDIVVNLKYMNEIIKVQNIQFVYDEFKYTANFAEDINLKVKLDIKINNDIFSPVKIEGKK